MTLTHGFQSPEMLSRLSGGIVVEADARVAEECAEFDSVPERVPDRLTEFDR